MKKTLILLLLLSLGVGSAFATESEKFKVLNGEQAQQIYEALSLTEVQTLDTENYFLDTKEVGNFSCTKIVSKYDSGEIYYQCLLANQRYDQLLGGGGNGGGDGDDGNGGDGDDGTNGGGDGDDGTNGGGDGDDGTNGGDDGDDGTDDGEGEEGEEGEEPEEGEETEEQFQISYSLNPPWI